MIRIDKSRFSAEELAQYDALIAKAKVDPEAAEKELEDEKPPVPKKTEKAEVEDVEDTKKSATPEIAAAMDRLAKLEKSYEMKEFTDIAKKYAPLGEKEDVLAQTLYDMKKSNEANYNAYIAVLDKSLGLVEKSGLFQEIGKSASGGMTGGSAEAKIESIAGEIMKADPRMDRVQAIAKAWTDHPELVAEYERDYK